MNLIQVNLLEKKKSFQLPVILGMDLNNVNLKLVAAAWVFHLVLSGVVESYTTSALEEKNKELESLLTKKTALMKKSSANKSIQRQIDELKKQEERLQERKKIVESILQNKKNPVNILSYISKNIPEDIWLTNVEIKENDITIEGASVSYVSIGLFIENLKNSTFFGNNVSFGGSQSETDEDGVRRDVFKITGQIQKFN